MLIKLSSVSLGHSFQCPSLRDQLTLDNWGESLLSRWLDQHRCPGTPGYRAPDSTLLLGGTDNASEAPTLATAFGWGEVSSSDTSSPTSSDLLGIDMAQGFVVLHFQVARRKVPAKLLKQAVEEDVAHRRQQGQRVTSALRKTLTAQIEAKLLAQTPPTIYSHPLVIDLLRERLHFSGDADTFNMAVTSLQQAIPELEIDDLFVSWLPVLMKGWLQEVPLPAGIELGKEVAFLQPKSADDRTRGTITYRQHALEDIEEIGRYAATMEVSQLGLSYAGRLTFSLSPAGVLSKISLIKQSRSPAPTLRLLDKPVSDAELAAAENDDVCQLHPNDFSHKTFYILAMTRNIQDSLELAGKEADTLTDPAVSDKPSSSCA